MGVREGSGVKCRWLVVAEERVVNRQYEENIEKRKENFVFRILLLIAIPLVLWLI